MRSTPLVVAYELRTTLTKVRFWVFTFLFPLLVFALSVGSQATMNRAVQSEAAKQQAAPTVARGYVDLAGIIRGAPPQVPEGAFVAFDSEEAALEAMRAGRIDRYYVIPADWLQTGKLSVVDRKYVVSLEAGPDLFQYLLNYNLTDDAGLAAFLTFGASVESYATAPTFASPQGGATQTVPYAVMLIFFFVLTMSSTTLLQSVTKEKENRTAEVLLTSLRPRELMLGKVISQGGLALLQMALWLGAAYLLARRRPELAGLTSGLSLPAGFIVWSLLYFVMGYLVFGSAMAAIGALAPSVKESGQFATVMLIPLMIPMFFNTAMSSDPSGALSVALSLIPLTAPVAMPTRLVSASVPVWQLLLGLVALAGAAYAFVALAGRLFRADSLLSTASLNTQRLLRELRA